LRFLRLVRDLSRKLGKDVQLVVEGEDTKADKNIIEALGDPLVHIIRNSLDHGFETPEVRSAAGKNPQGTLKIKASQASDRVLIEVIDDGKGIDPEKIKQSAFDKGLIDQAEFQRLTDREAINLIFLPGFSTAATVSDVSGRGVGMDAVRMTVEKLNGSLSLDSVVGKGTTLRLSLPLSMAVTQVMVIESDSQLFGVPTNQIVETVRVPRQSIQSIKHSQTTTLRNRVVPMKPLNELLGLPSEPLTNDDDELAMLVARVGAGEVGLVVDDFKGCIDIIQKPMNGVLSNLGAYTGSALLGDGSVLMVLNLAEIV
jgi:two-component system chemotaxis sensor kinase CheA